MELGEDLPVIPLPQPELNPSVSKPDGNRLFLIDGAAREDCERREVIGLADDELWAPQGSLHVEPEAVAGDVQRHA